MDIKLEAFLGFLKIEIKMNETKCKYIYKSNNNIDCDVGTGIIKAEILNEW